MASTHMAFGFVSSYFLAVVLATRIASWAYPVIMPVTAVFALVGVFGGLFPDIDQFEFWGPTWIRKYLFHDLVYLSSFRCTDSSQGPASERTGDFPLSVWSLGLSRNFFLKLSNISTEDLTFRTSAGWELLITGSNTSTSGQRLLRFDEMRSH